MVTMIIIERSVVNKTFRPIIETIRNICKISFQDIYVLFMVASLIFVVPTGFELTSADGPLAQISLSLILVALVSFFALSRSPLKVSPPLWRAFLWLMILRNCVTIPGKEFRPFSLLMWSCILISEYICLVDTNDKDARNR